MVQMCVPAHVLGREERAKLRTSPSPIICCSSCSWDGGVEVCGKHFITDDAVSQVGNNLFLK